MRLRRWLRCVTCSHAPQQPTEPTWPGPLAEFLGEAKSKIEELSTLLAEREEEFYSFKNDVRPAARIPAAHMPRSPHAPQPSTWPAAARAVPSSLPPPTSARCMSQQEEDYDDESEATDGVDNIDYADDEEDDDEDVGSEDRKAKLEVPHAPA